MRSRTDDLGVVDPIGVPANIVAHVTRLQLLPVYALAFLGIAVARTILDLATSTGLLGIDQGVAPDPGLVLRHVPASIMLLIPVAVGWSTQRFGEPSLRVVRGSVAIGLSAVASIVAGLIGGFDHPAVLSLAVRAYARLEGAQLGEPNDPAFLAAAAMGALAIFLLAGGLIWMAQGIDGVGRLEPSSTAQRAGLLVIVVGSAAGLLELAYGVVSIAPLVPGPNGDASDLAIFLGDAVHLNDVLIALGWTYLAWVLIRGHDDQGRPHRATTAGAVAGWLAGLWFVTLLVAVAVLLPVALGSGSRYESESSIIPFLLAIDRVASLVGLGMVGVLTWALAMGLASDARDEDESLPAAE